MNLIELQEEVHAIAQTDGFWNIERTFGDLIAELHCSVGEVMRQHKPPGRRRPYEFNQDGLEEALANVVIRVADMAEHYQWRLEFAGTIPASSVVRASGLPEAITALHYLVTQIWLTEGERPILSRLRVLLNSIWHLADRCGINLDAAIATRMEFARSRSQAASARCWRRRKDSPDGPA